MRSFVSWLLSPTRALYRHFPSFSPACVPVWPVWVLVIYNLVLFVLAHFFKNLRLSSLTIFALYILLVLSTFIHTLTRTERDWVDNILTSVFEQGCPVSQLCIHWDHSSCVVGVVSTWPDPIWKQVPEACSVPEGLKEAGRKVAAKEPCLIPTSSVMRGCRIHLCGYLHRLNGSQFQLQNLGQVKPPQLGLPRWLHNKESA